MFLSFLEEILCLLDITASAVYILLDLIDLLSLLLDDPIDLFLGFKCVLHLDFHLEEFLFFQLNHVFVEEGLLVYVL